MSDFNFRAESLDVEQIMEQIRARIREKRGVDYTEQQLRELAAVKLEKFLDPRSVRSDLLEQFKRERPPYEPPVLPNYQFEEATLFESHRAPLRWVRRLLQPILKLFFNPNPLIKALHIQSELNRLSAEREAQREAARHALDQLHYELIHNIVVELTRLGIETKNLKMRVESLTSRLEFNERRARALESVVVYKPSRDDDDTGADAAAVAQSKRVAGGDAGADISAGVPAGTPSMATTTLAGTTEGPGQRSRRRRRRRGRRSGVQAAAILGTPAPVHGPGESKDQAQVEPAAETHSETAENIERQLAADSHGTEGGQAGGSSPSSDDRSGSGGSEPDQQ
jgi:hypothetical protein